MKYAILCILVFWLGTSSTCFAFTTLQGGLDDGFAPGTDPAAPSFDLNSIILSYHAPSPFDGLPHNSSVAHTFSGLPSNILGGFLEFRVRGGISPGVDTDGIILSFVDGDTTVWSDDIAWSRSFGQLSVGGSILQAPDPGLLTTGIWAPGSEDFMSLDLAALPLADGGILNVIPLLNNHGFVDITVSDDTIADFFRLELETPAIPAPSAALLACLGCSLVNYVRRRKAI